MNISNLNKLVECQNKIFFRGDTREPKDIFDNGFQRTGGTWEYVSQEKNKKIKELTYRVDRDDIDPASSICVTSIFDCAPIFPIESISSIEKTPPTYTWVYVLKSNNFFPTYLYQGSDMQFCQELAVRDIPSGDVICAIKCERFYNNETLRNWDEGMSYQLKGDIIWNYKLNNEIETPVKKCIKQEITNLFEARKGKFIQCPTSSNSNLIVTDNKNNESERVKILLNKGGTINRTAHSSFGRKINGTPLYHAVVDGYLEVVTFLLTQGINVNERHTDGKSILFIAAELGWWDIFYLLLKNGAEIDAVQINGRSILNCALADKKWDIIQLLLDKDPDKIINATPHDHCMLFEAVIKREVGLVTSLLNNGATIIERREHDKERIKNFIENNKPAMRLSFLNINFIQFEKIMINYIETDRLPIYLTKDDLFDKIKLLNPSQFDFLRKSIVELSQKYSITSSAFNNISSAFFKQESNCKISDVSNNSCKMNFKYI